MINLTITLALATALAAPKAPGAPAPKAPAPAAKVVPAVVVAPPGGAAAPAPAPKATPAPAAPTPPPIMEKAWYGALRHGSWTRWTEADLAVVLANGSGFGNALGLVYDATTKRTRCATEGESLDFQLWHCGNAEVAKLHNDIYRVAYRDSAGLTAVVKRLDGHDAELAELKTRVTTLEDGVGAAEEDSLTEQEVLGLVATATEGLVDEETLQGELAKKAGVTEVAEVLATKADSADVSALSEGIAKTEADLAATQKEVNYLPAMYANVGIGYAASMNLEGVALEADLGVELPWLRFGGNGFIAFAGDSHTFWGGTAGVYLCNWDRIDIGEGSARFGLGPVAGYKRVSLGNRDEDALTEAMGDALAVGVGGFANIHTDSHFGGEIGFEITSDAGREVDVSTGSPERMPDVAGVGANLRLTVHFGGK